MELTDYLKILADKDGSNLYLSTGAPACAKFHGTLKPLEKEPMRPGRVKKIAWELMDPSLNLRAFVSQRLIPTTDGQRCAAIEVLLGTPMVKDLILKGEVENIKEVMAKSETQGMQTFDTALFRLYRNGTITLDEALQNADSANNLRLRIKLADEGKEEETSSSLEDLSLETIEDDDEGNLL